MTLMIGYGNPLRGDDGLGPHVVEHIARGRWPDVEPVIVHQLTPELSVRIVGAAAVVFVDAGMDCDGPFRITKLDPGGSTGSRTHFSDPRLLLALARDLFGPAPPAWMVTIAGQNFDLGEPLSRAGRRHAEQALAVLARREFF
jgi:hydrogenase maturation protease